MCLNHYSVAFLFMMIRTGYRKRLKVVLFCSFLSLIPFVSSQAALRVKDYKFPSKNVLIKEAFDASTTANENPRIIFCIQDAHCNYEAQKNTAEVLDYLVKNYGLNLVLVEGGSGYVGLSSLRGYAPLKTRQEVAERYLRQGSISGEEYFDLVSDSDIELYGIDDEALYDAHLETFWEIDNRRASGAKQIERLISAVNNLKPFIYSDELRRLEQKKKAYESKELRLADYCSYLFSYAVKRSVALDDYPAMEKFTGTVEIEKNMDVKSAEAERVIFIKNLASALESGQVKVLIAKTQGYKDGKLPARDYYSYLKSLAQPSIDIKKEYPSLSRYIDYVCGDNSLSPVKLIKEISALEEELKNRSFTNDAQRRLSEISRMSLILKHLFDLELTPEEYSYFKANRDKFGVSSWKDFISAECQRYNLPDFTVSSQAVDGNLDVLEKFYKLGAARESVFIKNMEKRMDEAEERTAVLITGGFHTPGITKALKTKGYSYVVLAPVITEKSDSSLYFSVLKDQKINEEEDLIDDDDD